MQQLINARIAFIPLLFVALAGTLMVSAPTSHAQLKKRVEVYTVPESPVDTDFGRKALIDYVDTQKLTARQITEKLFQDYTLVAMADVLRTRLLDTERDRLNVLIKGANIVNLISSSTSAESLAAKLDDKGVSRNDLVRELGRVFEGDGVPNNKDRLAYYPKEAIAYWIGDVNHAATRGYNERFILARLKGSDAVAARPGATQRVNVRFEDLEKLWEDENDDASSDEDERIWRDQIEGLTLSEQLEIYFGLSGVDDKTVLERLYEEANLKDKHLTQDMLRAFKLADAALCASLLEDEGLGKTARYGFSRNFSDMLREDGVKFGSALIARLQARVIAQTDWLRTVGDDVSALYVGTSAGSVGTPELGVLTGDDWKTRADRGIAQTVLDYFAGTPNMALVLYTNNSVRAQIGGTRYEGLYDPKAATLTLTPIYGGGITLRYEKIKLPADGLIFELEVKERTEARRTLLRRSRRF